MTKSKTNPRRSFIRRGFQAVEKDTFENLACKSLEFRQLSDGNKSNHNESKDVYLGFVP